MNDVATIPHSYANLDELLQQAEQPVRASASSKSGRMRELAPPAGSNYRVALQDTAATGICLILRMELPATASLCNSARNTETTLAFLGRLADSLASNDVQPRLLTGTSGVEAVMLSRHLCETQTAKKPLAQAIAMLGQIADTIRTELASDAPALLDRIDIALRPDAASDLSELKRTHAVVVPNYDPARRDAMMKHRTD